jgi:hypothetical protein
MENGFVGDSQQTTLNHQLLGFETCAVLQVVVSQVAIRLRRISCAHDHETGGAIVDLTAAPTG